MDLSSSFVKIQGFNTSADLITEFNVIRSNALTNLYSNPIDFAKNLYQRSGTFITRELSKTFPIDDDLCFLTLGTLGKSWIRRELLGPVGAVGVPSLLYLRETTNLQETKNLSIPWKENIYILKEAKRTDLFIRLTKNPPNPLPSINRCGFNDIEKLSLLECDEFTNETLIGFVLNYVFDIFNFKQKSLPKMPSKLRENIMLYAYGFFTDIDDKVFFKSDDLDKVFHPIVRYYGGFVCKSSTYIFMEYCDLGSLDSFILDGSKLFTKVSPTIKSLTHTISYLQGHKLIKLSVVRREYVYEIISQIVCALIALQNLCQFTSGDLKLANIFITSRKIKTNFNGLPLNAPFTCKIADYGKSSITIKSNSKKNKSVRLYNYNTASSATFSITSPPSIGFTSDGTSYYIIPKALVAANITPLAYIRHLGYPFYKSFDLYTFIVSMMLSPSIYYSVMTEPTLRSILWDSLWFFDELDSITKSVHDMMISRSPTSYRTVIPLIIGKKLKCDILNTYFEGLKNIATTFVW